MVSPELKGALTPESLRRWENTENISVPYAGGDMEQETQQINEHLNRFVSQFKHSNWMNHAESCRELNRDTNELTRLIKSRRANLQGNRNLPFLKRDLFFCQESIQRASEVKEIVDFFNRQHASKELIALSGSLAKLMGKFDKELVQDTSLIKTSIAEKLQDAIRWAYNLSTKKSPHYVEDSLGMTLGKRSSDNRALSAALKPSHQNLPDNAFFNKTLAALQLLEKAYTQQGDEVPPVLAGKLAVVNRELFEMFPKNTHVWLLRKTIADAYKHYSSNYRSTILEQSLGRHFGANSAENRELRAILHHPDLENAPDNKLAEMTQRAVALIRKGFHQMENERIPPELARQLKVLDQFNR